jgi:hypothetical protein
LQWGIIGEIIERGQILANKPDGSQCARTWKCVIRKCQNTIQNCCC